MADKTKIEWADATVNCINGCSLASPGCTNCFAMKQAHRVEARRGLTVQSKGGMVWTGEVRFSEKALLQPLAWKRPRRIFWNAHGDTFHDNVPDEWIDRVFAACAMTPQHTHMILTKRSARMRAYFAARRDGDPWAEAADHIADLRNMVEHPVVLEPRDIPLPNVWLGVSVEDQTRADERIPDLLATPAAVRFISAEPLLGPVDIRRWMPGSYECGLTCGLRLPTYPAVERCTECGWQSDHTAASLISEGCPACHGELEPVCPDCSHYMVTDHPDTPHLDWVIAGGESGPGARPMHPDWARSLRDQCADAGVAFHFKQWGEWTVDDVRGHPPEHVHWWRLADSRGGGTAYSMLRTGKARAGRLLDGIEHNGIPT